MTSTSGLERNDTGAGPLAERTPGDIVSTMPRAMLRFFSRAVVAGALCVLAAALGSCADATTAPLPSGSQRFTPPEVFRRWWALTEQCSGLTGDYDAITWYVVPGAASIPGPDGSPVQGTWELKQDRIVLAGNTQFAGDLVRHEMLHALLRGGDHPRDAFIAKCGGVVVCIGPCLEEAGPAPPPDPAAVPADPSVLEVNVTLEPERDDPSQIGGHFIMWVAVRNPTDQVLAITLPRSSDAGPSVSFEYRLDSDWVTSTYNVRAQTPEVTRFAPRETKRFAFDFMVSTSKSTRYDITPGTYRFAGAYGDHWANPAPTATVWP
ncbi:MAG TPA: hypothetical protein VL328_15725 [Gemmatimonadaceae bacterium]|jgi:hypothetical protein|nr:hypothetical protein [Gemmatimonadaceae bacterium]